LIALVLLEIGVFGCLKRSFLKPIWNCVLRVCYATCCKLFCCCKKSENKDIMKGINVVDTEAVLKIVDQDPELEASRVEKLSEKDLQIKI